MDRVTLPDSDVDWEAMWAPYDEATYQFVLEQIRTDDIVLDIGAGDLRLARQMVKKCRKVYAIEIQEELLSMSSLAVDDRISGELVIIHGDARQAQFPQDVTAGVLLMRHCTHFNHYADKLKVAGAERLFTNTRWRMNVEVVQLQAERILFDEFPLGWYACWCGVVGFKPGPVEKLTQSGINVINEVVHCPHCNGLTHDQKLN